MGAGRIGSQAGAGFLTAAARGGRGFSKHSGILAEPVLLLCREIFCWNLGSALTACWYLEGVILDTGSVCMEKCSFRPACISVLKKPSENSLKIESSGV
jgi:hypothetical protein